MDPQQKALEAEVAELRRKADMLASMHACLRDRYAAIAGIAYGILSLSTLAVCVLTLARQEVLSLFPVSNANTWVGLAGAVAFGAALVSQRADWGGRRARHEEAVHAYAGFKQKCGRVLACRHSEEDLHALTVEWQFIGEKCIAVPEREFAKLKAAHLHKVAVSKALSDNPGAPVWLVGMRLRLEASRRLFRSELNERPSGVESPTASPDGGSANGNDGLGTPS